MQLALGFPLHHLHLRGLLRHLQRGRRRALRPGATASAAGIPLVGLQEFDDFLGEKYGKNGKIFEILQGTEKAREENVKVGTGCLLFGNWRRFFLGDDP